MARIIGIGGASRSGKSSLAKKLKDRLATKRVLVLDQDDFVKEEKEIPKIKNRTDWEHPDSIDLELLLHSIDAAKSTHDVIIVEGLLAFHFPELLQRYDMSIFIGISQKTFQFRRQQETRWGREPNWYVGHVWNAYLSTGQYAEANFQLDGENEIPESTLNELINVIL